jgi:hypothetical protein
MPEPHVFILRAIADIERLQAECTVERQQQQSLFKQMQQHMQAELDSVHAALADTETQRDAAIGRASVMRDNVQASQDFVKKIVEAVFPVLQADEKAPGACKFSGIDESLVQRLRAESQRLREIAVQYPELQSSFNVLMSQNATLSSELDLLRETLTKLQCSANQTVADLSEKEAELRIQKRERFECESKLYAAATEHDRMLAEAHASSLKIQQLEGNLIATTSDLRQKEADNSFLRQELGLLREQLEEMRQLKDSHEKACIVEQEKAQRLSAALSQAEAESRNVIARYQQLESKLSDTEAERDTLRRSEKDRNNQLQRSLADVQHLGSTVQEQLALIEKLEAENQKLSKQAQTALAYSERAQQNESMIELLKQALVGLQEDRRTMQGTVEQLKSVETQQLASKLDGQAELLRVIAHESAGNRQVIISEQEKLLKQLESLREQDFRHHHASIDTANHKVLEIDHTSASANSSGDGSGWTEVSMTPQVMEMKQASSSDIAATWHCG